MSSQPSENDFGRIGLALSGGGFRASAFHLGVLKRLFELGVLQRIATISTVSGGSIVGAFLFTWQESHRRIETRADWNEFEKALTAVMRGGIRGKVFRDTVLRPVVATTIAVLLCWHFFGALWAVRCLVGLSALSFAYWYRYSTDRLAVRYDEALYDNLHIQKISQKTQLVINATSLDRGKLLQIASNTDRELEEPMHQGSEALAGVSVRTVENVDAFVSRAVAASSAVPGLFRPVRLASFRNRVRRSVHMRPDPEVPEATDDAVDGGIFDNQGTYALLNNERYRCSAVIVSDAAQVFEQNVSRGMLGLGVLQRSQEILLERVRTQSYEELAYTRLPKAVIAISKRDTGPLPRSVTEHLPKIRTDLDRFSRYEIWALMNHGYHLVDHCLEEEPALAELAVPSSRHFEVADDGLAVGSPEIRRLVNHLRYSGSRILLWRWIRRVHGRIFGSGGAPGGDEGGENPSGSYPGSPREPRIDRDMLSERRETARGSEREFQRVPEHGAKEEREMANGNSKQGAGNPYNKPVEYAYVLGLAAILVVIGWVGLGADADERATAWLQIMMLITVFFVIVGRAATGVWRGILIDSRYKMSLGRLQLLSWTLVILSTLITAVLTNVTLGWESPLEVDVPSELWVLMGITTASSVGGSVVLASKKDKKPVTEEVRKVDNDPQREAGPIVADSIVVRNTSKHDARWADLLKGDETGNATAVDVGKLQMLFFTFALALGYSAAILKLFEIEGPVLSLPPVDDGMNVLLGISHTGYVAAKSVTHSAQFADGQGQTIETNRARVNPPPANGPQDGAEGGEEQ